MVLRIEAGVVQAFVFLKCVTMLTGCQVKMLLLFHDTFKIFKFVRIFQSRV